MSTLRTNEAPTGSRSKLVMLLVILLISFVALSWIGFFVGGLTSLFRNGSEHETDDFYYEAEQSWRDEERQRILEPDDDDYPKQTR